MSRALTKRGVQIPHHQITEYVPHRTEYVQIPSATLPQFGAMFNIDVREQNVIVEKQILQFNLSAITVMTSGMYVPAQFFVDHIDYVFNGNIIDTYTPLNQFLQQQLFEDDEDRALANYSAGHYASTAQRIAMATTANSYYLPLYDFFRQSKSIALLEPSHNYQLRVFMQPLASITSGTGTATATINSVNLIAKVIRLRDEETNVLKMELFSKQRLHAKFNDLKNQSYTVNSGVSSTNIVLSAITGPICYLIFVVRPTASLTGNNAFNFTAIASYEILNSSGQNIVGGQPISNSQALLVNGNDWCSSSYLTENALGVTNNGANVYIHSFSADPVDSAQHARSLGAYNFSGSEQLKLNFVGSLGASVQVDCLAYCESVLEQTKTTVNKRVYHH